jgi:ribosomal protein S18 acetylase RimI-like enzyme
MARLWLAAYPPDIATGTEEAQEAMRETFADEYGEFWLSASPLVFDNDKLVAAICTVRKAPWSATPTCPFITDLMVDPDYRRQGLAAFLILKSAEIAARSGAGHIALRVLVDNRSAINLYDKLGFIDWDGKLCVHL